MKKILIMFVMMILICHVAFAEDVYEEHLDMIAQGKTAYTITTVEYDTMQPADVDPADYIAVLKKAVLNQADPDETPDGEFAVLTFPEEEIYFDFFFSDEANYVRMRTKDGQEQLYRGTFPENEDSTFGEVMSTWTDALAYANGIPVVTDEYPGIAKWLEDSINGTIWMDDRASLEVIPEDDGYKVLIHWGGSAWESAEWTYSCYYVADTESLNAVHFICEDVVYDDEGKETRTVLLDEDCSTVFALNENGQLVIRDAGDAALEGKTFQKIPLDSEGAAEMVPTL